MPPKPEPDPEKLQKALTRQHIKTIASSIGDILAFTNNLEFRQQCLTMLKAQNSHQAARKIEKLLIQSQEK